MITFVIPTWNRAANLKVCVESIASQNPHRVVISDNASTDGTEAVARLLMNKYPCVEYFKRPVVGDFQDSYKSAVMLSESKWTWTFGDDDVLLPLALAKMLQVIEECPASFYHVAEDKRVFRQAVVSGPFFELCSRYGWLDITGFISGNVTATEKLKESVNVADWEVYGTSAFPHSCGLLEVMMGEKAVLAELPMVRNQQPEATEDTLKRWHDAKTTYRYLLISDALARLQQRGVVPAKFEEDFFRYLNGSVFYRLMHDLVVRALGADIPPSEADLKRMQYLTNAVSGHRGEELAAWGRRCIDLMKVSMLAVEATKSAYDNLVGEASSISLPHYEPQYIHDQEA